MYTHVTVGTNDLKKSQAFYDAVFAVLGAERGKAVRDDRFFYRQDKGPTFIVLTPINGEPATPANGGTIGFRAASIEMVDAWHAAGMANGGTLCEGLPTIRDAGFAKFYAAYLRDPDGNKLCAMTRAG